MLITRTREMDEGSLVTQWILRKLVTTFSMLKPLQHCTSKQEKMLKVMVHMGELTNTYIKTYKACCLANFLLNPTHSVNTILTFEAGWIPKMWPPLKQVLFKQLTFSLRYLTFFTNYNNFKWIFPQVRPSQILHLEGKKIEIFRLVWLYDSMGW